MNTVLKEALKTNICQVKFTKANGDVRDMRCTLSGEWIPEEARPKPLAEGAEPRKVNEEVQPVYDLDAQGWRAFRWDSIIEANEL